MSGLEKSDAPSLGQVAVLDDDDPAAHPVADHVLDSGGHRAGCLSCSDDHEPPSLMLGHTWEGTQDERANITGSQGSVEDAPGCRAERHRASFCSRRPASINTSSVLGKQKRIFVRPSSPWA